jgi:hypothetical protein
MIALTMEAVSSSKTSFSLYQITWSDVPEDSHIQPSNSHAYILDER